MDVKQIAQMMGMPVDQAKEQLEQMLAVMMQNQHRSTLKKRESRTEDAVEFMKTKYTEERMEQEENQAMMKSVFDTVQDMIKAEADKGGKTAETTTMARHRSRQWRTSRKEAGEVFSKPPTGR